MLCAQARLADVAVLAVEGTKVHANSSERSTREYEQLAREILDEAATVDAAEDEQFGDHRGDGPPPELASSSGRRKWLAEAKRRLDARREPEARPIPASRPARVRGGQTAPGREGARATPPIEATGRAER